MICVQQEFAPAPSPSPPAHVKSGDPYAKVASDPYAQPLPLSPVSDEAGDPRFRFPLAPPPAISSFSTLSGWAGDFGFAAPPPSSVAAGTSLLPAFGMPPPTQAGGSGQVQRTSGWYQPPGWQNSIQGQGGAPAVASGMPTASSLSVAGAGEGFVPFAPLKAGSWAASSFAEWPTRTGDVEMYDAGGGG